MSSFYAREIHYATRLLCANRGAMAAAQLLGKLLQHFHITEESFCYILRNCSRFLMVRSQEEEEEETGGGFELSGCTVVAKTSLRLCRRYSKEECSSCQELHLCKYFVYGNCRFGKGRKPCKFSHDIWSSHNLPLLRECTLHELNEDELFLLLLQNDPSLLPEVLLQLCAVFSASVSLCSVQAVGQSEISTPPFLPSESCHVFFLQVCVHYNKGSGPHGACTFQERCTKVHMCMHFLQGDCMFGRKCNRQHDVEPHGRRMLEERGLSSAIIHDLPHIYQNIHHLSRTPLRSLAEDTAEACCDPAGQTEQQEICLHHLRSSCRFQDKCIRVHFNLPYKWEVFGGETWEELQDMEEIERDFCDPRKSQSSGTLPVDFLFMRQAWRPVRRLSTVSSVVKPPHYVLTTEWLWYYKGDQGNWVEYGQPDDKQRTTSMTSHNLEEAYMKDSTAEVTVAKGHRLYYISFQDMYQRNPKHNTKRQVRRRPRFVSVTDVEKQAAR
ncbi:hypothetical protein LDENG_00198990 [Lucifuga dentata]|nr:hypothetical protein LDENG_00198990 [Lucifuga dentata]